MPKLKLTKHCKFNKHSYFRDGNYNEKAFAFNSQATRLASLAKQAVAASDLSNAQKINEVNQMAGRIEDLTPQVENAGRIVLQNPDNKAAAEHFDNLKSKWMHRRLYVFYQVI